MMAVCGRDFVSVYAPYISYEPGPSSVFRLRLVTGVTKLPWVCLLGGLNAAARDYRVLLDYIWVDPPLRFVVVWDLVIS